MTRKTRVQQQAEEIEQLRRELASNHLAEELREAVRLAATVGSIAAPVTHSRLLEMVVETAAQVIGARAASLFLIDESTQELVFEVALGQKADAVKHFRVPLGRGVAGLVAATGQPMAISDAQRDERHASEIAASVGYLPETILCVPLVSQDEVIGVLELLDKLHAPAFGPADMDALSHFADQAAVAIQQSRTQRKLVGLLGEVLASLGGESDDRRQAIRSQFAAFAADIEGDPTYERALELAQLVREIALSGSAGLELCHSILTSVATYTRTQHRTAGVG